MLPQWLEQRYHTLWNKYKENTFRAEDAQKVLKEKFAADEDQVNAVLSELRKNNLLKSELDPEDARKRIYRLIQKQKEIFELKEKNKLTRSDLETLLKGAADLIRTRVDYSFILLLLFYKRISDKWEMEYQQAYSEALEDGLSEKEADQEAQNSIYHDFDISRNLLWNEIRKDPARIPENFSKAMKDLAERNSELKDVFENVDFVQFTNSRENSEILRQLVELFSAIRLDTVGPDILGDAYEWLLRYFAPQKAKEGEVYTPREVIQLIIEILDPKPGESVYDPACGSGGMLITSYDHVKDVYGRDDAGKLFLFGQEANHRTLALSKMNLYIHDIRNAQLSLGDTLLYPKFKDGDNIKKFDVVIANPPWNQDGYGEDILKRGEFWKQRFSHGFTPKQSADWAWVQHMFASADDKSGRVGVVIDNGCLFRGGKEKTVRTEFVKSDFIEAVILLPEKLFYNTGAPGAIMILNKNKPKKRRDKILFINASNEYRQHLEVRKLNQLGEENINKIVDAYKEFKDSDGISKAVDIEQIQDNDFNLNVTLYVFPEEKVEDINIEKEWNEIGFIKEQLQEVENKIESYLIELEIINHNKF